MILVSNARSPKSAEESFDKLIFRDIMWRAEVRTDVSELIDHQVKTRVVWAGLAYCRRVQGVNVDQCHEAYT